jgi:hypothetical protein
LNPALVAKVEQAKKIISDQCVSGRWQMCIPPQSDDSDIVLCDALDALMAVVNGQELALQQILRIGHFDKHQEPPYICPACIAQNELKKGASGPTYKYEARSNYARNIFEEDPKKYSDKINAELRKGK